jgi:uncharacterized protein (TIGR00730 family)
MNICLFCAARTDVDEQFHAAAEDLGKRLAERKDVLYYGGGTIGLMGTAARASHKHGGRVVGVIPASLRKREVAYEKADEMIVTTGTSDRKEILIRESDAFVILAGGFGTLDELFDVITTKQLGYHGKPIVIVNTLGYFDPLLKMFDHIIEERFAEIAQKQLFSVCLTVDEALSRIDEALRD